MRDRAFDPNELRAIFKTEEARQRFDKGLANSERRVASYLNKTGCDCPRCLSNEDHKLRYGSARSRAEASPRVEEYTFSR